MVASAGTYGGVPAAQRRAERRERLLDAALDLLGREGYAATTVRGVCRRARLTPRYFYESFVSLDALVVAVYDRIVEEAAATMLEALDAAPDDARAKSRAAIEAFVRHLTDDPRRLRVSVAEALGSEPLIRRRQRTLRTFAELVAAQAREFYRPPPTADRLVSTTAHLLVGGLAELLIAWHDGSLDTTIEQLIDDCTELFVATGEAARAIASR